MVREHLLIKFEFTNLFVFIFVTYNYYAKCCKFNTFLLFLIYLFSYYLLSLK